MLPAHHGDCLWIEYGPAERPRRVLVDGGPAYAYPALKALIEARLGSLPPEQRRIELLVITHVDADHIGGILRLLEDTAPGVAICDVWFNGWRHLPGAEGTLGPVQGERVTRHLLESRQPWNAAWGNRRVAVPAAGVLPRHTLPGGLELTILAPELAGLARLRPAWEKTVRKAGLEPGAEAESEVVAEEREAAGALAVGIDPLDLAAQPFKEDTSPPNGSSIALLAEFEGRRVLLGGDSYPSALLRSLLRWREEQGLMEVELDAFKVPHHGGRSNLSPDLLRQLRSRRYLVSTNGRIFRHPHAETLARVVTAAGPTTLCFNYRTPFNAGWDDPALREQFGYETKYPENEAGGLFVPL